MKAWLILFVWFSNLRPLILIYHLTHSLLAISVSELIFSHFNSALFISPLLNVRLFKVPSCSVTPKSRQTEAEINTQSANHTQLNQNVSWSLGWFPTSIRERSTREREKTRWIMSWLSVCLALMSFLCCALLWTCAVPWWGCALR